MSFPFGSHDDMLDALSRVVDEDLGATFPNNETNLPSWMKEKDEQEYDVLRFGL